MLTDILRGEIGFDGIIIIDALNMGAIVNTYGSGEAAVKAFLAGVDMILAPGDFHVAYSAVLEAVESGRISTARLDESLRRILGLKLQLTNAVEELSGSSQEQEFPLNQELQQPSIQDTDSPDIGEDSGIRQIPYTQENGTVNPGFDGIIVEQSFESEE